jgi:hypothetical protein
MLIIHPQHLKAFADAALLDFEERMLDHLRDFAPRHFRVLTDDEVRAVIRHGMERAAAHHLTTERGIRYYVDVMFMFGSGFDDDPLIPWAAPILDGPDAELVRADRLYARAWANAGEVHQDLLGLDGGEGRIRLAEELRSLRNESDEPLPPGQPVDLQRRVAEWLSALFPRKIAAAQRPGGVDPVRVLLDSALVRSRAAGIGTDRGVMMLVSMMGMLGAGCADDPLLPWASAVLRDGTLAGAAEKADRLYAAAVTCLGQWWGGP